MASSSELDPLGRDERGGGPCCDRGPGSPAEWVDRHGDALFRYAMLRVRDRDTAEDLVQETFLAALEASSTFRGDSAFRSWLVGTLRHKVVDHYRRHRRGGSIDAAPTDSAFREDGRWVEPPAGWSADPSELAENRDFLAVVRQCLTGVPGRAADAFTLRVLNELPATEVCEVLGVSPGNLWVLLHRARAKMRACLEVRWFSARPGVTSQ